MTICGKWLFAAGSITALLVGCGESAAPPKPDVLAATSATATAAVTATATASASSSETASASGSADPAPSASASAEPAPSASASGEASASPSGSASAAPVVKGFAFPAPKSGVLTVADADKLIKVGAPARVRLLVPGAEPLVKLVYGPTKGDTQKLRVDLSQKMSVNAQGKPGPKIVSPPQSLEIDVIVDDVDDKPSSLVSMWLRGLKLTPTEGIDQDTANDLTKQLAGLVGYSFRERVAANGEISSGESKLPAAAPKGADMLVASMNTVLRVLIPRLPDEAIGTGAKWQVISREDQGGASVVQLTEYTLKSRSGDTVGLDFGTRQLAAGESMKMPAGVPEGVGTKVTRFVTTLSGSLTLAMSQLGPTKGRVTQETKLALDVTAPGQAEGTIKTDTDMKMTVTIARRAGSAAPATSAATGATGSSTAATPAPTAPAPANPPKP